MTTASLFNKHEWCIIESEFKPEQHQIAESIFSIGNGSMGQRANFEETYSGKSLRGNYIGGVFYADKTRVGWWKNGYPNYFAKVLNAPSWIDFDIRIDGEQIDLAKNKIISFSRCLDMQQGLLIRDCVIELQSGKQIQIQTERFISIVDLEIGAISYTITSLQNACAIEIRSYTNSLVHNEDSNYQEVFWESIEQHTTDTYGIAVDKTKKTPYDVPQFTIATAIGNEFFTSTDTLEASKPSAQGLEISQTCSYTLQANESICVHKLASQISTLNYAEDALVEESIRILDTAFEKGYSQLRAEHCEAWKQKWTVSDICIEGDIEAQQGIRFNIFQLQQTYSGNDSRLNIGPKGFTGEKYGGSTYWDTEAFCLPFYLSTSPEQVAKQLLVYRHNQLGKAIENAEKLGFTNGAALYPMVTMTGEECHNEWEITFEEIHRNGAIAYAIYNYVNYTDDKSYLIEYGLEVLIAISRFWAQRVSLSPTKRKYMILGVTGPNEYENNVNNNWYTNFFARWCMRYTLETISWAKRVALSEYNSICTKIAFDENYESLRWTDIINNMYIPTDSTHGIILQQDGYLDKELKTIDDIPANQRPINQHWSWDRILRSCYIKQADVVQGLYMFEKEFDLETIEKNFTFYESRCLHESSLSPCIHSVVASKIGQTDKAYELYLRTARLDLDDYNKEAHEGLHITSMAGTWLAVVQGFAGMRAKWNGLEFAPILPKQWKSIQFNITYRGAILEVRITNNSLQLTLVSGVINEIYFKDDIYRFTDSKTLILEL